MMNMSAADLYFYVCPNCMTPTSRMTLLIADYEFTREDVRKRPSVILLGIGHERLSCPCGRSHTWFTLLELKRVGG